ncbi:hypothetical protein PFTANZ_05811 [Plasmodium falciparum Tanzania (2000708)]|uniref:Uncharacterized protein n=1 Tax=Plasmodium falciparum Tanzania (2000708) TaxID=1036725 RepID=A0A024W005_PLAFA|nr:hypothetical protein PFTANZ_05811 [Plasmodium falciparum Tanzania (2000708)]
MSLQNFGSIFYRATHYSHPQLIFLCQKSTSFIGGNSTANSGFRPIFYNVNKICHPNFGLDFRPKDVFTILTQNYIDNIRTCHYKIMGEIELEIRVLDPFSTTRHLLLS